MTGFVGFGCSFGGKWFGGYAETKDKRNYCDNAFKSTMRKAEKLQDVIFYNLDYSEVDIPKGSLVYCDIPYKDTTGYSVDFDHEAFYSWVRQHHTDYHILISEYEHNVPEDFEVVWALESKQDMNSKQGKKSTTEVLMTYTGRA